MKKVDVYWENNIQKVFERISFEKKAFNLYTNYRTTMSAAAFHKRIKNKKNKYQLYKEKIINKTKIKGGVEFWKKNNSLLNSVSLKFGIPIEIIVSIIGIETIYDTYTGNWCVLNCLYTLAFNNSKKIPESRKKYFARELQSLLKFFKKENYNIDQMFNIKGSFTGAVGIFQFMPYNVLKYSLDGNNDNIIDVYNVDDAIISVAIFLKKKGWKKGKSIINEICSNNCKENKEKDFFKLTCDDTYIMLDEKKVYINNNFCVLKRYNNSNIYAMTVYEMSVEIKKRYYNNS
jgi:membrane-bound lytic murein transglycosylase B